VQETVSGWLLGTVVPGLGATLVVALIGLAREWIKGLKEARVRQILNTLVEAAEQLYGPGKGEAKRRFVREKLKQQGLQQVGREELEAAVYNLGGE
jgi:hypothetical protein